MPPSRHRRRRSPNRGRSADMAITQPRRKTNYWYVIASAIIALLVIGGFSVGAVIGLLPGGSAGEAGSSNQYVGGIGEQHPIMPSRQHLPEGQSVVYSTSPPTSGDHWDWWARCGFYGDGLPDERIVHNLEHGNIVVSYNLASDEEVGRLREVMDNLALAPAWAVTRFYDKIPEGTVALSAWGVLDTLQGVQNDRIESFFQAYSGTLGPEFPNGAPCFSSGVVDTP